MTELGLTRKEEIWLACKQKSCCYAAFVVPNGRDIWRIARTLDSPPWAFLVYFPAQAPRRDAFSPRPLGRHLLGGAGERRDTAHESATAVHLPAAHALRRAPLRPGRPATGGVQELPLRTTGRRPLYGCRHRLCLPLLVAGRCGYRRGNRGRHRPPARSAEYCAVVARWNACVAAAPPATQFSFFDYCAFLLEAYDAPAAVPAGESAS